MDELQPSWSPDASTIERSNIAWLMREVGAADVKELHAWTVANRAAFWRLVAHRLEIDFTVQSRAELEGSAQHPVWFPGAVLNIAASALDERDDQPAVVHGTADTLRTVTYGELRADVGRCVNGLLARGIGIDSRVAIVMSMNYEAVVAYLAVVALGGAVISIADSFASEEIASRLDITGAELIVTQSVTNRGGKIFAMYAKVMAAVDTPAVVVDAGAGPGLRAADVSWADMVADSAAFDFVPRPADAITNILFSSGTTGHPKAIPWTQLTPLKAAMDGHFHHDIHPDDVVAWPTNLGWMMGPWLIYASLLNGATMALCDEPPIGEEFIEFARAARVSVLGVVPSVVAAWRGAGLLEKLAWPALRVLSSTGEASRPDDMDALMRVTGAPVIEYCGGTEIGGGYIAGTVLQPAIAATFSSPCLGLDFVIVDENGHQAEEGEVLLVPPSVGLSTMLLNRDHDEVYHAGLPAWSVPLRRHGDHMRHLDSGHWRALGRVDDTMNLGGIKVSAADIERVVESAAGISEVAAIAVPPSGGGPDRLVLYAVPDQSFSPDLGDWRDNMQRLMREKLNPLFKISDVVVIDALPRTASGKVMRRSLRKIYEEGNP